MYDYLNNNPECMSAPVDYTNDIRSISALDNFISINNAVDIDLFGQVNAESAGVKHISVQAASWTSCWAHTFPRVARASSPASTFFNKKTGQLESRIRPTLENGSIITDTRANLHYLCTEYGCVNLKDLTTWEKAEASSMWHTPTSARSLSKRPRSCTSGAAATKSKHRRTGSCRLRQEWSHT